MRLALTVALSLFPGHLTVAAEEGISPSPPAICGLLERAISPENGLIINARELNPERVTDILAACNIRTAFTAIKNDDAFDAILASTDTELPQPERLIRICVTWPEYHTGDVTAKAEVFERNASGYHLAYVGNGASQEFVYAEAALASATMAFRDLKER